MKIFKALFRKQEEPLVTIATKIAKLSAKIGASEDDWPTYGYSEQTGRPHIEIDQASIMHYVNCERGCEFSRKSTNSIDELLFWVFESIAFSLACKYELANRMEDKDCRRIMFARQEELLGILSPEWQKLSKDEHTKILKEHPFDDLVGLRATYWGQLRKQGYPEQECEKMAYAKYP